MNFVELVQDNMLDYAGAVNQSRAIPDARTGLKPIHRKILYEMYVDKIKSSGKFKKCAAAVGQVIARFSEHGDAATYEALVRMSQPWIQRYPIIDFHGNNGSQFGDGPASMRYTETKLTQLAEQYILANLNKNTVDWIMNFTNEEKEPITFPSVFPGLFCLPNQGMGYGTACHFLTYNLSEVADMIINYINTGTLTKIYPDLASGGILVNPSIMESIYNTGKGSVIIDAKYQIKGQQIIITEIPFNVMFDDIMDNIIDLCKQEKISGIDDIRNESGKGTIKMVIDVVRGYEPENIINQLFNETKLRNSYPVNQVALVENKPQLLSMRAMVNIYIDHNKDCIKKEFEYDLQTAETRIEILEGLTKALEDIDNIIQLIKSSSSAAIAKEQLIKKYNFSQPQVDAILNMKLSRLANMEKMEIEKELQEKQELALQCKEIVDSSKRQEEILIKRLRELVNKFGDSRRTQVEEKVIVKKTASAKTKEVIIEDVVITYSETGYIQNIPVKMYKTTSHLNSFKCQTDDMILLFSSLGKLYRVKINEIKQCGPKDKGIAVGALVNLEPGEKILNIFPMNIDDKHPYITGITKFGQVKKSDKTIYLGSTQNKNGLKAAGLKDGDIYIGFYETNGDYITLITNNNMAIQFELNKINPVGKTAKGVAGIKLTDNDFIVKIEINQNKNNKLPVQGRNGKGVKLDK